METLDKDSTLEEIRQAQADLAAEMDNNSLTKAEQRSLEKASLYLSKLEGSLVNSIEDKLIEELKSETSSLSDLITEMKKTTEHLFKVTEILDQVVKITGQLIDILAIVK
jgi:hypothetical protein